MLDLFRDTVYSQGMTIKEEWRPIKGYPKYEVSSLGRVRSLRFGKVRMLSLRLKGGRKEYLHTTLSVEGMPKSRFVHSLVLEAFHGDRPEGMEGSHIDGDRMNNRPENLAWESPKANAARRIKHGTQTCGTQIQTAKLKDSDIPIIKKMYMDRGLTQFEIAKIYGLDRTAISNIVNGKAWKHVA